MTTEKKFKVLLVEDDPNLRMVLVDYLEMLPYEVTSGSNGEEGLVSFLRGKFDICLFDIMMPRKDGFTLAEEVRKHDKNVPIIFLTAKTLKEDRIKGFQSGCDDYITKPFSTEELSYRIQAILRRTSTPTTDAAGKEMKVFYLGDYIFDSESLTLSFHGKQQKLTKKESELLKIFCKFRNQLITRGDALKFVWGDDDYFIGRSMDVFIAKLRKHLKDDSRVNIVNIHGTGFKLIVTE
jgi:two-component system, OmpR family, response regulator